MKATEISRVPLPEVAIEGLSADLSARAWRMLGFNNRNAVDMARMLIGAQIEPLNSRDVERYKQSKLKSTISYFSKLWLGWSALLLALAIAIPLTHLSAGWWPAWAVFMLVGSIVFGVYMDGRKDSYKQTRWEKLPLSHYGNYIPEFVLAKAVALKTANNNVSLSVEYLATYERENYPDPFLVATIGHKHVYIDVWDEPEFERQTRG